MPSDEQVHPEHHSIQRRVLSGRLRGSDPAISDGIYGVQAGHNPVLVALHMGMLHFVVDGKARDVLVGDGIAEVTPAYVMCWWTAPRTRRTSTRTVPKPPASALRNACSISRACTNITRAKLRWIVPCSVCRPPQSISAEASHPYFIRKKIPVCPWQCPGRRGFFCWRYLTDSS